MDNEALGPYLKELRLRAQMSLRGVSGRTGISNSYLSQVETGQRRPGTDVLARLSQVYGVRARDLLERAGHLEETELTVPEAVEVDRAYEFVLTDPRFRFGTRPQGELDTDSKRFIVQMYETLTGKRLL